MYKDFAMYHFPLGRLILLPLHIISNWDLRLDPFVGLAVGLATLYTIYLFGKRHLSNAGASSALIFFSMFYWFFATGILYFHEQLIGLLLVAAILFVFDLHKQKKVSAKKLFSIGILLSLAELSGQIASLTVAITVFLIIYILWRKREIAKNVIPLATGLFIPFILLVLYFLSQNALADFIFWNTLYYFTYSQSAYSPLSELPLKEILAFYIPLILLTGMLMLRKKLNFEFLSILLLGASTIPFTVFSIFHFHHFNYALGILAIAAGYSYDELRKIKNGNAIFVATAVIFILLTVSTVLPWYTSHLSAPSLKIKNDVYPGEPMYDAILWVKDNTPKDAKLMVFADPLFYMRAERLPASRPSKGMPYSWMPFSEVRAELRRTPADYWVTDQNFSRRLSKDFRVEDMLKFVESELETCYKKVANFDTLEIWERVCKP